MCAGERVAPFARHRVLEEMHFSAEFYSSESFWNQYQQLIHTLDEFTLI